MTTLNLTSDASAMNLDLEEALSTLTSRERNLAMETWRGRMRNEYVSARIFEQLLEQMKTVGVSLRRQESIARMMEDELRHGKLCAGVVLALGGEPISEIGALPDVPKHGDADALEALLRNVLSVSCLSETVAVGLISAERLHSVHPVLEETLRSILADEVQHARFGWTLLDDVSDSLTPRIRRRLGDYLAPAFASLRAYEFDNLPAQSAPSDAGEAVGLCDGPSSRRIFMDTVTDVIIPGLEAHGLPAARAWSASLRIAA